MGAQFHVQTTIHQRHIGMVVQGFRQFRDVVQHAHAIHVVLKGEGPRKCAIGNCPARYLGKLGIGLVCR